MCEAQVVERNRVCIVKQVQMHLHMRVRAHALSCNMCMYEVA